MKAKKQIRNRTFTQDSPTKVIQLRVYEPSKNDLCHPTQRGHDYRFYIGSRLGTCSRCGSEILT